MEIKLVRRLCSLCIVNWMGLERKRCLPVVSKHSYRCLETGENNDVLSMFCWYLQWDISGLKISSPLMSVACNFFFFLHKCISSFPQKYFPVAQGA